MGSTIKVTLSTLDGVVLDSFVVHGQGDEIALSQALRDYIGFKFSEADTEADLHLDE